MGKGDRQKAKSFKLCFYFFSVRMQFGGKHRDRSSLKSKTRFFKPIVDILFTDDDIGVFGKKNPSG